MFAHAIHGTSLRLDKPFIKVNCAAIPEILLESEFFGHEKGAFTGALKTKLGKMELERVGGSQTIKVDVRVIAATNRNLLHLKLQIWFASKLYYFKVQLESAKQKDEKIFTNKNQKSY
ncbi:Sigma-54 interaction domain-containing protein [Desulfosporosinus lacus DSM 15449]|uniref:Sigma-54 interaction domain-containing protein n=1 Tax=Desulfosporosinus lacus DSM 15449 TaxID=1121420 RepID=A0A1M6AGZ0_9FIRM|nr:Sigma-54 interaction domain-containing protein [Desulfosporosinus lacus DSM 15449]